MVGDLQDLRGHARVGGVQEGPCQLTGSTSISPQRATSEPSARSAAIWAVGRVTPVVTLEIQAATLEVSGVSGRVSRMFENVTRDGSAHTNPLLPPSWWCSISTADDRPSHPLK